MTFFCFVFETGLHCLAKAGLEFTVILLLLVLGLKVCTTCLASILEIMCVNVYICIHTHTHTHSSLCLSLHVNAVSEEVIGTGSAGYKLPDMGPGN